jgi:uncharacterized protein
MSAGPRNPSVLRRVIAVWPRHTDESYPRSRVCHPPSRAVEMRRTFSKRAPTAHPTATFDTPQNSSPVDLLNDIDVRVLGSLVEKELTTPEYYPLSLNALVNACNQTSNRDPVVKYDEPTVKSAVDRLRKYSLVRSIQRADARVMKYLHLMRDAMSLEPPELAAMGVLMLRGPQTVGEIRTRSGRLFDFPSLEEVEATLNTLMTRPEPLVARLPRQSGQKEARFSHLLGGGAPVQSIAPTRTLRDLAILLDDRPGALADMGDALGRAGVSIEGGGAWVVDGVGVAHFLFSDAAAARQALDSAGIQVLAEREVVVQRLRQGEPGRLGKLTRRMAEAGVNIEALYSDHDHQLILVVDDIDKARAVSDAWARVPAHG